MNTNNATHQVSRGSFVRVLALGLTGLAATRLWAQDAGSSQGETDIGNLRTFVALARSDIRSQKAIIIAENMDFSKDEAIDFWPIHSDYNREQNKLLDRRFALLMQYKSEYGWMTNDQAKKLAEEFFDLEDDHVGLKRKYFKKFCKKIPATKAARFFQIENQLNLAIDLKIAASLPLLK